MLTYAPPCATARQRLAHWVTSTSLGQDIGTLQGDSAQVRVAVRKGATAVHTLCAAMADDAQTFNDQLPAPDAALTQLLARAYTLEYDAAEACYRAGATNDALLTRSAADRRSASRLFDEVLRRVDVLTGRTVPTTTTTVPDLTGTGFL